MYWRRSAATICATLLSLGVARAARAQEFSAVPADPPVQAGPLVLAPVVSLINLGYDNNVFNLSDGDNPQGDMTATFVPGVDGWLRLTHARVAFRSQYNFYYYRELSYLRDVDYSNTLRIDIPISRVTPFVSGELSSTRPDINQNYELNPIIRRKLNSFTGGASVRLSERTTFDVYGSHGDLNYKPDAPEVFDDVAQALNYESTSAGISGRYAVTSLTSLGVEAVLTKDRFDVDTERDSDTLRITPFVEFSPSALISGRAVIGFQQRSMVSGTTPDYNDTYLYADLGYTLLEQTRFSVSAERRLEYSFFGSLTDYVQNGLNLNVAHRLNEFWDLGGSFGKTRLHYREVNDQTPPPDETIYTTTTTAGYNIRKTRVGFMLEYRTRDAAATVAYRAYNRLRVGSTVTYRF